ncbi:MAG: 5,10-methylenetetrahydrofolate reductase [Candidatus Dichloromethanomonas elyunquensis]|nr:MAG: 5,10-methylenetetrahydrofolate reductase [Candidatus Dichloromethanomonas elyunquensis]
MKITELFKQKQAVVSFEIFPPKQVSSIDVIFETIDGLVPLRPDYISVTYGAGGSSTKTTVEIAAKIKNKYGLNSLAHLTCIGSSKSQMDEILNELKDNDISNILVLRGDFPRDANPADLPNDFKQASDLAQYIASKFDFCLGGACYPEIHPECSSLDKDIENLKRKVDAGVSFLVTQLFFNNDQFYRFRNKAAQQNINVPIQAGIMPITNRKSIEKMLSLTNSEMPLKLTRILDKFEHNQEAIKDVGIAYATEQIIDLLSQDVNGVHIFTMNKPQITKDILRNLGSLIYSINKQTI